MEDIALVCEGNNAAVFQYAHVTDTTGYLREYRRLVDDRIIVELQPSDFSIN